LQLYVENAQDDWDTIIQADTIAEDERVLLPVMVCQDGFLISHTSEPVNVPDQNQIDDFLPSYEPKYLLDPDVGMSMPNMPRPLVIKFERIKNDCMNNAVKVIDIVGREFGKKFGRKYDLVDFYRCDDAETLLVTMGSMTGTAREAIDQLRDEGLPIGLLKIRSFRPFPVEEIISIAPKIRSMAVVDRNIIHGIGGGGGALFTEIKSSIYNVNEKPIILDFIAGIAGREITIKHLKNMALKAFKAKRAENLEYIEWMDDYQMPSVEFASLSAYEDRIVSPGIRSCAGCSMLLTIRHLFQKLGKRSIFTCVPGCAAVCGNKGPVPLTRQIQIPYAEVCFAGTAAVASGIKAGMTAKGKTDVNVIGLAGDGGTVDIGFQALSAAAERGDSIIYVCYDNEAYMNTGIQKSGSTPFGAWTNTTPMGARRNNKTRKKDLPAIMELHGIPYLATASIGYIPDLIKKVEKAKETVAENRGLAYLHIHAPCPIGWRFSSEKTVEVARLAVESGMWLLYEVLDGEMQITHKPSKRVHVKKYLRSQGRFNNLTDNEIEEIQDQVDKKFESQILKYSK
jgi:pyruvate ferredoxin oxidoreductase beta subunit